MIKHYCDRCAEEIDYYKVHENSIGTKGFHDGWENENYFIVGGDFCKPCRRAFKDEFMENREVRPRYIKKKKS